MELTLFVVADLANNAFNRVQMARDIVESYLLPYTSEVEKVSADLALEAEIAGVEIVYTSSAKQIISNAGAYVRPLDDTKVNFQVMYKYQILVVNYTLNQQHMTYMLMDILQRKKWTISLMKVHLLS